MDISGVNDDWEHQVTPLLQDMGNCDEEYFNPQEVSLSFCLRVTHSAPSSPLRINHSSVYILRLCGRLDAGERNAKMSTICGN